MGLKTSIKSFVMRQIMKKRKANGVFDEAASEAYELPDNAGPDINNSYYFTAHTPDGASVFFRLGKRGSGENAVAEVWTAFRAQDGSAYVNSDCLFKLSESPASVECVIPLRKWKFSFSGKMLPVKPGEDRIARPCGEPVDARFEGTFTSQYGLYEFTRDTELKPFCRAIAAETWKKGFSDELNHSHQVHIEQEGHITGELNIGGKRRAIDAPGIRDHSYGRRVWSYMNRHAWLITSVSDGSFINTNMVRYPALNVVGIQTGYKMKAGQNVNLVDAVFPEGFGLSGGAPKSGSFTAFYSDKSSAKIEFQLDIAFPFSFDNGSYIVFEGLSAYTVNGVSGRGISEFGYNGDKTRYEKTSAGGKR